MLSIWLTLSSDQRVAGSRSFLLASFLLPPFAAASLAFLFLGCWSGSGSGGVSFGLGGTVADLPLRSGCPSVPPADAAEVDVDAWFLLLCVAICLRSAGLYLFFNNNHRKQSTFVMFFGSQNNARQSSTLH
jgi:hypothetical protein